MATASDALLERIAKRLDVIEDRLEAIEGALYDENEDMSRRLRATAERIEKATAEHRQAREARDALSRAT